MSNIIIEDADEAPELDDSFFTGAVLTRPGESLIEKLYGPLPAGTLVKMTRAYRKQRRWSGWKYHGVHSGKQHVREFGRCVGMVLGLLDYNNCKPGDPDYDSSKLGPEVDVRWQPSNLRYGYDPEDLEIVR
jgi:hypothetical protein